MRHLRAMTVREWQEETGATGEPEWPDGTSCDLDQVITLSPNGEEYCVGHPDGNETWLRFDLDPVIGDATGGWREG